MLEGQELEAGVCTGSSKNKTPTPGTIFHLEKKQINDNAALSGNWWETKYQRSEFTTCYK